VVVQFLNVMMSVKSDGVVVRVALRAPPVASSPRLPQAMSLFADARSMKVLQPCIVCGERALECSQPANNADSSIQTLNGANLITFPHTMT